MKVLVTGGAGFIGSHIADEAVNRNLNVTVFDNFHSGYKKNLQSHINNNCVTLIEGDITDPAKLKKTLQKVDTVFHLAALTSVPESITHPQSYLKINTQGTFEVLQACLECKVSNLVFSSSAAIYGDSAVVPKHELMRPEPKSMYAISKLDGEMHCQLFKNVHGINATALRYFNVFGPRQDPHSAYAAAIPLFIEKALRNEPITIFGDGQQTRDFVFVKDVVQANFLAAEKGSDVVNVAYGNTITINELAQKIITLTGSSSTLEYLPPRPGDIKHSYADNQKICRELGFRANSNLDQGLTHTINFFSNLLRESAC